MELDNSTHTVLRNSSGALLVHVKGVVGQPRFEPLMLREMDGGRPRIQTVPIPSHRLSSLKNMWE
jgi:hypothetical protein